VMGTGQITGTEYDVTIDGKVTKESDVLAKITLPYAGTWVASLSDGVLNDQQFKGSPFEIVVVPAATDPAACISEFTGAITAGEDVTVTVAPFDSFSNPTSHPDDKFNFYLGDNDAWANRSPLTRTSPSTSFSASRFETAAGTHSLHVEHRNTETEVSGSPFYFQVTPGPPHRDTCEHSLESEESR